MEDLPLYKVLYNSEEDGDLYGISIVDAPANKQMFLTLSEQVSVRLQTADNEKQLCTGIVLIPNQKIYREFEDGSPYLLTFDGPTIERLSQDFLRKGYQNNATFNHDDNNWLSGSTIVESWIVQDANNDKLSALGFKDLVPGTWAVTMKLSNELWDDYIKTGLAKGFSIDSFVKYEKINLKKQMEKQSLLSRIVTLFSDAQAQDVKCLDVDSSIGLLTVDALEVGHVVYDKDMKPVVNGEFDYSNNHYTTDEKGSISEVSTIAEEKQDAEPAGEAAGTLMGGEEMADAAVVSNENDDAANDAAEDKVQDDADWQAHKAEIDQQIKNLQDQIDGLVGTNSKLTEENLMLSEEVTNLKSVEADTKLRTKGAGLINLSNKNHQESTLDVISRLTKNNQN